ncbi:MAG: YegP family protein [Oscillospiraceae bacterium]|nr:YegP family protein [Oscillospiraceae bacterium]
MGKYALKEVKTGWKFNLLATNGQVIGTSEVYTTEAAARNGIASVAKNAPEANLEDQTLDPPGEAKNPKFQVYIDKAGEYRFRLTAKNGEPILASEGYKQKASALNGVESVRKNADGEIAEA